VGDISITLEQQYSSRAREKPGPSRRKSMPAADWLREYLADGEKFSTDVVATAAKAVMQEDAA